MNGVVLAAGFGTRFDQSGKPVNKAFLPIGRDRRVVLDIIADGLLIPDINSIHIMHNAWNAHEFKKWKKLLVDKDPARLRFPYLRLHSSGAGKPEESPGAVACLDMMLQKMADPRPFVLCFSDVLHTYPLREFIDGIRHDCAALATCHMDHRIDLNRYGKVDMQPDGEFIRNFFEKSDAPFTDIWLGPAFFPASACELIKEYVKEQRAIGKSTDNLGNFIAWYLQKERVQAWFHDPKDFVFDLGTRDLWQIAKRAFRKKRR